MIGRYLRNLALWVFLLSLVRGEQWASIQAARKQRQQLVAVTCLIAIVVLVGVSMTRDG